MACAGVAVETIKRVAVADLGLLTFLEKLNDLGGFDLPSGDSIDLDAIAGSENKDFIAAQKVSPFPLRSRSNVTLPSLYARGVMTDTDAENAHQVGRVSDTKLMAQRTETAAVKARMQSAAMRFGARR